jgi:hypothetical protein
MIGFLVKKNFFDLWDNMFRIVLLDLGFLASLAIPIFIPALIPFMALSIAVFGAGLLWCCIYLAAAALSVKAISDYGIFGFSDFLKNLKAGWPAGMAMGAIGFLVFIMVKIIIPFYWGMNNMLGFLLAAVIFWTLVIAVLSFQFFLAIRARLDTKLKKIFKKCFIIFFDNPVFAVFILLYTVITLILSALLAFLLPGPAGILLFLDEAMRLRLLKYDWLETASKEDANLESPPGRKRRQIPWDEILIEEREKTGTRSFKSFIFPWKD